MASSFTSHSPYHFAYNNPVLLNDPKGAAPVKALVETNPGLDGGAGSGRSFSATNVLADAATMSDEDYVEKYGSTAYSSSVNENVDPADVLVVLTMDITGEKFEVDQTQEDSYPTWTHEAIIKEAFNGILTEGQIKAIMDGSEFADSKQFQTPEKSYMHAMTGINYVNEKNGDVNAVKELSQHLMNAFVYQQGYLFDELNCNGGDQYKAFFNLGMGMHPLMDQFSPEHSGFQVWDPGVSNGYGLGHFLGEANTSVGVPSAIETIRNYYEYWK